MNADRPHRSINYVIKQLMMEGVALGVTEPKTVVVDGGRKLDIAVTNSETENTKAVGIHYSV